jgi:lipid A 3-O-deacylase
MQIFKTGKDRTLTLTVKVVTAILAAGVAMTAVAQSSDFDPHKPMNKMMNGIAISNQDGSPVDQVRKGRSWEYGPFVNFGNGIGADRSQYRFLALGLQAGKILTRPLHAGILSGQFEFAGNIMPFWQAYTPAPHDQTFSFQGHTFTYPVGGGTFTGASITPVIFRWNFLTHSQRIQPWFQAAGGLVYTTHKFPPDILSPHGIPGGTSVWNFSPQGGIGVHYFTRPKRSIDLGLNAMHISSASLGDHNPGVNALWQIQLGYTYWK